MPNMQYIFPLIPLALLGLFAWRYVRNGSLVGALLGGRLADTIGELPISSSGLTSRVLRISLLDTPGGGPHDIALAITSKAPFGASVVPVKLSHAQALELIALLQVAAAR